MSVVLKRDIGRDEEVTRSQDRAWDSLRQIEIMFAIEDCFAIRFTAAELAELSSLSEIAAAVEAKTSS